MKLKRKLKRKWENIGTNQKMMMVFVSLLFFITVGYAAINQVLKITGYASLDKGDGMIFTSVGINNNNQATIEKDASIKAKTLVNTQVSFQSAGSITFQVSAQNQGTTDAKLIEIKGLEESNIKEPSCIQVSVQDHNVGDLVFPNQIKNFTITITSTCSTYSSKELDLHFVYEKQETINGVLPVYDLGDKTNELLDNSTDGTYNYMDGTYLKGSQDSNYIWFDGFMWRIMGTNADGSIRMITEENVTAISWGRETNGELLVNYDDSYIVDWLNSYFYPKLKDKDLLVKHIWCSESVIDASSSRTTCTNNLSSVQQYVGLISLDEYNLSNQALGYLSNSQHFWTITPVNNDGNAWSIDSTKEDNNYASYSISGTLGIRPVVNVKANVIISSGVGTITDPYMIEDMDNVTGSLKDNSQIGEYVTYAGRNYRVVETSSSGTKLILDGYYDSNNDGTIEDSDKMMYGENCTLCTTINEEPFINWISNNNETDKNKLVSTTWYRGDYWGSFTTSYNYKDNLESISNPYEGRVGLIRAGEMLSSQSETILSKNHTLSGSNNNAHTYWLATPRSASLAWSVGSNGSTGSGNVTNTTFVRPVIMIHPGVPITGGQGTPNDPYTLGEAPLTAAQYLIKNNLSGDINTSPTNGLFAIDNTGELTTSDSPREYRYIGANPDNYIQFNNELWRIIGIFDGQLKIIRNESLGEMVWQEDNSDETNWYLSSLKTYLNNDYYNTINENDKLKIDNYTWKLGASSDYKETAQSFYEYERNSPEAKWTGKIALIYPSDSGFATSGGSTTNRSSCLAEELYNWLEGSFADCYNNNWLYGIASPTGYWAVTASIDSIPVTRAPAPSTHDQVFYIWELHPFLDNRQNYHGVLPTLYLKSDVEFSGGTGTNTDPYILK